MLVYQKQSVVYGRIGNRLSVAGKIVFIYRRALFEDVEYRQLLLSAVRDMALSVPVILVFSMIVAVFLNKNFPGRAVFQIIFFIPVIVSSGIIPELFENDLVRTAIVSAPTVSEEAVSSFDTSSMSALLISLNIPVALVNYIMQAIGNILEIVNSSGIQILVFTMGLKSISPSLYLIKHPSPQCGYGILNNFT